MGQTRGGGSRDCGGAAGRPGATLTRTAPYPVPVSSEHSLFRNGPRHKHHGHAGLQALHAAASLPEAPPASTLRGRAAVLFTGLAHDRAPELLNRQPKATYSLPRIHTRDWGTREQRKRQVCRPQPSQPKDP